MLSKRDNEPIMQWDFKTIKTCTSWYDNNEGLTCKEVRDLMFDISPEDFSRWDPSITLDYENWRPLAYCVGVKSEQRTVTTSSASSSLAAKPTATPTLRRKPELLGWLPLGCYVDKHTLHNRTAKAGGDQLTVTECEAACFSDNFQYAGVKAGTDCWCGTFVGNSWTENQEDCNIHCPGDSAQICGGASVFNVFEAQTKDTLSPPSTATTTAGGSNSNMIAIATTVSSSFTPASPEITPPAIPSETTGEKSTGRGVTDFALRGLTLLGACLAVVVL
ncbi:hypothetical protein VTI74DRAFT_565 [Chaetomium olivicolor]